MRQAGAAVPFGLSSAAPAPQGWAAGGMPLEGESLTATVRIVRVFYPAGAKVLGNWASVLVKTEDEKKLTFKAAGNGLEGKKLGDVVTLSGVWGKSTDKQGRTYEQLSIDTAVKPRPTTIEGIVKTLSSGLFARIGPKTARRIVEAFGLETWNIIDNSPEKLKGIVPEKAYRSVLETRSETLAPRAVLGFLASNGLRNVTLRFVERLLADYNNQSDKVIGVIKKNPYILIDTVSGVGFKRADALALALGTPVKGEARIRAGLKESLKRLMEEKCHVCAPRNLIVKEAVGLLNSPFDGMNEVPDESLLSQKDVDALIDAEIAAGNLVEDGFAKDGRRKGGVGEAYVYLKGAYADEVYTASWIRKAAAVAFADGDEKRLVGDYLAASPVVYNDLQRRAIEMALTHQFSILTGGPGTGKTTTTRAIVECFEALGFSTQTGEMVLLAPTGAAAKRMASATGRPASTVHRYLGRRTWEIEKDEGGAPRVAVLDEVSMADNHLMAEFLRSLDDSTRVLVVGDKDQLPSVGAGKVLADLRRSGIVPEVELTEIYRQDAGAIVTNAHAVARGDFGAIKLLPEYTRDNDFWFIRCAQAETVEDIIRSLVGEILPAMGFTGEDIQVLSPIKPHEAGVYSLNFRIQDATVAGRAEPRFEMKLGGKDGAVYTPRVGDRIMVTKNNYDLMVFNGEAGRLVEFPEDEEGNVRMKVDFRDRVVEFGLEDRNILLPAHARTVHKSQGSEYPVVIMPLLGRHVYSANRALFYTALTRAQKLFVLISEEQYVEKAVRRPASDNRHTQLAERLVGPLETREQALLRLAADTGGANAPSFQTADADTDVFEDVPF